MALLWLHVIFAPYLLLQGLYLPLLIQGKGVFALKIKDMRFTEENLLLVMLQIIQKKIECCFQDLSSLVFLGITIYKWCSIREKGAINVLGILGN